MRVQELIELLSHQRPDSPIYVYNQHEWVWPVILVDDGEIDDRKITVLTVGQTLPIDLRKDKT